MCLVSLHVTLGAFANFLFDCEPYCEFLCGGVPVHICLYMCVCVCVCICKVGIKKAGRKIRVFSVAVLMNEVAKHRTMPSLYTMQIHYSETGGD